MTTPKIVIPAPVMASVAVLDAGSAPGPSRMIERLEERPRGCRTWSDIRSIVARIYAYEIIICSGWDRISMENLIRRRIIIASIQSILRIYIISTQTSSWIFTLFPEEESVLVKVDVPDLNNYSECKCCALSWLTLKLIQNQLL